MGGDLISINSLYEQEFLYGEYELTEVGSYSNYHVMQIAFPEKN